jgi:hypothetical protein
MSHDNFIKFKGEQYQYEISKKLERSSSSGSLYGSFFFSGDTDSGSIMLKVSTPFTKPILDEKSFLSVFIVIENHSDMRLSLQRHKTVFTFEKLREENGFFVYKGVIPDEEVYYSFDVNKPETISEDDFYVTFFNVYGGNKNCKLHFDYDGLFVTVTPMGSESIVCNTKNFNSMKVTLNHYFKYWGRPRK